MKLDLYSGHLIQIHNSTQQTDQNQMQEKTWNIVQESENVNKYAARFFVLIIQTAREARWGV